MTPGFLLQPMNLVIEFGEYRCSATNTSNAETVCALKDTSASDTGQSLPPVVITVDFGDGSGEQYWTREDPRDLWTHKYQLPGKYWVHVNSKSGSKVVCSEVNLHFTQLTTFTTSRATRSGWRWRW